MPARTTERLLVVLSILFLPAGASADEAPVWRDSVEVASGKGLKGPWRQNDSQYDYVDDGAVALGPGGEMALAWVDQGKKDVFFRGPQGATVNVSNSERTFSWLPRIAFAPHDARLVFVLWQEIIFSGGSHGGDILFARSTDGGRSFSSPLNLSRSREGDGKGRISREVWDNGSLDLAAGADGAVYAGWTDYEGTLYLAVSSDAGASFTRPARVAGDARRPARAPALAIGPDRSVYLAWTHGEDTSADIYLARSTNGGAGFSAPLAVARTREFSDAPKLAVDARGALHLAWADGRRILYARSTDSARSFEAARPVAARGAGFPFLAVDRRSNVCIVWEKMEGPRPKGLAYSVSRDGGRSFSAPADVPASDPGAGATNGSQQGLLAQKLAAGADGALALVNSSLAPGGKSRVWLVRGAL